EKILYQAHPHIGTNKLPHIIAAMRQHILACGGEVHFEKKLTDIIIEKQAVKAVACADGKVIKANYVILATGHSARDIFTILHNKNIAIEAKPFALGVRVEHPQGLIDSLQYKMIERGGFLPPASYSLVQQVQNNGVFSFCMCPGGIIAPAATNPNELVVNGWSPSKRNNPFANSGMVVTINMQDAFKWIKSATDKGILNKNAVPLNEKNPLLLMHFQQIIEERAYAAGGGKFVAPAQRMVDFYNLRQSANLPDCSYLPGVASANLHGVLPSFVAQSLRAAFQEFGKKMNKFGAHSYFTNDAVLVATESRTSSPVRIPRNADTLEHIQIKGLYPCAEGAGYAGGIVSAAMDGERVAANIALKLA
ncbi:MAG: NAD(P)/FAD-dependent oxidoreductase, partial [Chitinophagaceae bacterium]